MRPKAILKAATPLLFLLAFATSSPAFADRACQDVFQRRATLHLATEPANRPWPHRPVVMRELDAITEIRIMQFNVEDLMLSEGSPRRSDKSPEEIREIGRAIRENNPDFIVLEEVSGVDVLQRVNAQEFGNRFDTYLLPGNDSKHIGFLVKKDLPLSITMESHREVTWVDPNNQEVRPLFSRDVPSLLVRHLGVTTGPPLFILLGNHAKSMMDRDGDPRSNVLRTEQYRGIARILDRYVQQYGRGVSMILAGDFNIEVRRGLPGSEQITPVRQRMVDVFDVVQIPIDERATHSFHPNPQQREYAQLDAIFLTPDLSASVISAEAYRYRDPQGRSLPLPRDQAERELNPSDHYPVVVRLRPDRLFKRTP